MGFWLIFFEKRKLLGTIALMAGVAWFIISTQLIIPLYTGDEAAAIDRYSYLGDSVSEIVKNLIFKPNLILENLFSGDNIFYLLLLFIPLIWGVGVSFRNLTILIPAIPTLALNLLSTVSTQKNLVHQYSLPILPFLIFAVIINLSANKGFLKTRKSILIWCTIAFLALSKFTYFGGQYLEYTDNLSATKEAIALVSKDGKVYTTSDIIPHLTHRQVIKITNKDEPSEQITNFDYVLLNIRHPGYLSDRSFAENLLNQAQNNVNFQQVYQKDDVYLFEKIN